MKDVDIQYISKTTSHKRRANLAFPARQSKRSSHIMDTWVALSKVMVKDNCGRITTISTDYDLRKQDQFQKDVKYY